MNENPERARVSLSVDPAAAGREAVPLDAPPFCLLVLGDFSGRDLGAGGGEVAPLVRRRPLPAPSLEDLLARLRPTLEFELDGPGRVRIEVRELEDLHPDSLVEHVPHLRAFVDAIDRTVAGHRTPGPGTDAAPRDAGSAGDAEQRRPVDGGPSGGSLLDEIAESTSVPERVHESSLPELEPWIRDVVAPHLVHEETADQEALRRRLEREAAAQVLRVLHAPPVRALEGLLRSLLFLLASADPTSGVRVHVLDLARSELEADLGSGDLEESALLRILADPLPGPCGQSAPAFVVGAYEFGSSARDISLLNRIAMLSHVLGAPWVSAATADLLGAGSFGEVGEPGAGATDVPPVWEAFRRTEAAGSVGLVAPPFLTREPYGPDTDPCRLGALDEVSASASPGAAAGGDDHEERPYLWGNPAFVCAAALAGSFARHAWQLQSGGPADFTGQPIHVLPGGDVGAHPTAAVWGSEAVHRVLDVGVMPLVTFRDEARFRLPRIGSVSAPPAPLHAWWSGR